MDDDATKPPAEEPTPDVAKLLKILELQSAAQRAKRAPSAFQAPGFRYGILVAIVIFTFASLGLLEWFLSQLPRPAHPQPGAASPARSANP